MCVRIGERDSVCVSGECGQIGENTRPCQILCCMSFVSVLLRSKPDQYKGGSRSAPRP